MIPASDLAALATADVEAPGTKYVVIGDWDDGREWKYAGSIADKARSKVRHALGFGWANPVLYKRTKSGWEVVS